ncbi:MAG TPA: branched-chain amino acid ABC transporter substrate-binding protein [Anaerolineae bacterium]|nr:branched-chain amino acid ABC transporter substrate-binding protein [Anaerolineae bacterium]
MKRSRNRIAVLSKLLPLLVILLLLAGCPSGGSKGDIVLYVAAPLSGFQANGGQTVVGGVRLMAEEINRSGGLLGYQIKVVAVDDESDSDVAVSVAEEIQAAVLAGERVLGVVGHYNSGQTLAAMEVYKDLPIIVITPTASEVSLTHSGYGNFFRINANNTVQAQVAADYLINTLGVQRVAVLYNDDPYGIDLGGLVAQELQAMGADVVLSRQVKVEQSRFTEEVGLIAASDADSVFYAGYEVECPYLRAELVESGHDLTFMGSDGCFLAETIDQARDTAEGIYVAGFAPSPASAADSGWIKAYQAVDYRNPDTYSINGYVALQALAEGVKKAGSLDAGQIADALRRIDLQTLVGRVRYDDRGDLREPQIYIFQVQQNEFVQVWPEG